MNRLNLTPGIAVMQRPTRFSRSIQWHHHGVAALLALPLLAGCATGPDYVEPPAVDLGAGWIEPVDDPAGAMDLDTWWTALGDPELSRLVEQALENNLDVRRAVLRIEESRALLDATRSRQWPAADVRGGVTEQRQTENGPFPIFQERDQTIYDLSLDATWEIDLFGRVRRAVESADARLEATAEDARAVRISIAAEVARTYFALQGARQALAAREARVAALEASYRLAQRRVAAGDLAPVELETLASRLDSARAALPRIEGSVRDAALALGTLLGGLPEQELALIAATPPEVELPAIPAGQRAELLRRRPDIRAAERRLAASTAEVGAAMAERFPKLVISATGGFEALDAGELLDSGSQTYAVAPFISWRIFDGGRVRAEIDAAEVRQRAAALAYEEAVLGALGEAERAMSSYRHGLESLARQRKASAAAERVHELTQDRYRQGDVSTIEVLDSEQQLYTSREAVADLERDAATALAAAVKALGGGWPMESGAATVPSTQVAAR